MVQKHLLIIGRDAAPSVSDILRRDSADSGMQGPLNSTLRGYGLASQARETDGGGAPSLPSERRAFGDAGARELAGQMVRKHLVIIGRDAAPSVSDI